MTLRMETLVSIAGAGGEEAEEKICILALFVKFYTIFRFASLISEGFTALMK